MSGSADIIPFTSSIHEARVADKPFNNRAADAILRTSDRVDFYVYRTILSLASPVFEDMFSLPQPERASGRPIGEGTEASHPVIDVSEDSRTLDFVLRFCYPLRKPIMTELKDVAQVLLAACKYDMDAVLDVSKVALEQCIEQDILGAFALACRCELYDICSKAAMQFIQRPFLSLESKELNHITADQYHRLLEDQQCYAKNEIHVVHPKAWYNSQRSEGHPSFSSPTLSTTAPPGPPHLSASIPRDADAPFDDKTADTILRSCDQVDFHVHSFILSFSSATFKSMFLDHQQTVTAGSCPGNEGKPPPIINVPEDSCTLDVFLRCCYPIVRLPSFSQLSEARLVLAAGLKYDVDAVKALVEAALMEFVNLDILGVWSIALRYKLRDACNAAAKQFLRHPQVSLHSTELGCISAHHYDELLRYHKRCGEAASAVASSRTWFHEKMSLSGFPLPKSRCRYCWSAEPSGGSYWYAPSSLWTFLNAAKGALKIRPYGLAVLSDEVWNKWPRSRCSCDCGQSYALDIAFAQAFANEVDRAVAEVELPSFF